MPRWRTRTLLLVGGAALAVAIPAFSQNRDAPQSLLPPGFGDPQTPPPPEQKAPSQTRPAQSRPAQTAPGAPAPGTTVVPGAVGTSPITGTEVGDVEEVQVEQSELPRPTNYFNVPAGLERPVEMVGPLDPGNFGLGPAAFGPTRGELLTGVMRRLDAPLPSRWTSILLRRALLSRVPSPAGVRPVDWVAERASLLLKMGEADAARMLVQAVDVENYTPRMVEVAAQTALATADPAALCPLVGPARSWSNDPVWTLADGMCAALEGEPARATALIDQARNQAGTGVDLLLAEKVVGAGAETRRSVNIDWQGVDEISPWRFGLASAVGVPIPAPLMNRAGPQIQAWLARAPMVPLEQRLDAAATAASLGVFSSHSLVEIYSLLLDQTDPAELQGSVQARLRTAWVERDPAQRMTALRSLWGEGETPRARFARLILTAGASARIVPAEALADDSGNLIAAMLTAGMDHEAARWAPIIEAGGASNRAWAMLAVASPRPMVSVSAGRLDAFADADDSSGHKRSELLVAALAGLGRISPEQAARAGFRLDDGDVWTAALDRATAERAPGTIALLAAVGMQTADWSGVPPPYLFRMVRALRTVGMDYEARMIAAEALARL